jgi:hypothetical protein
MSFTPSQIQKLWRRIHERFGPEKKDDKAKKKPDPKELQVDKEKERGEKGLTRLRQLARGDLKDPRAAGTFTKARDRTLKPLRKYCKLLKGNELKDSVKNLSQLRKAMKQLTAAVEALGTGPFPEVKGEPDLNILDGVDTTALDQALQDPNFGEYSEEEFAEEEPESALPEKTGDTGSPQQRQESPAALFKARLQSLTPGYQNALKANAPNRGALELAMKLAVVAARNEDHEQGLVQLDKLEAELSKADTPGRSATTATSPPPQGDHSVVKRLNAMTRHIKAALAGPEQARVQSLLTAVNNLIKDRDFVPAGPMLDELESLVRAGGADGKAPTSKQAQEVRERLTALLPALKDAAAAGGARADQVRLLQSEVATLLRRNQVEQALEVVDRLAALTEATEAPETPALLLRERALVMDAHRAFADYLGVRDSAEDAALLDAELRRAEGYLKTWRAEVGDQGSADNRERMALLASKIELERGALDEVLKSVGNLDALLEAIGGESDPERRAVLREALEGALQGLSA